MIARVSSHSLERRAPWTGVAQPFHRRARRGAVEQPHRPVHITTGANRTLRRRLINPGASREDCGSSQATCLDARLRVPERRARFIAVLTDESLRMHQIRREWRLFLTQTAPARICLIPAV